MTARRISVQHAATSCLVLAAAHAAAQSPPAAATGPRLLAPASWSASASLLPAPQVLGSPSVADDTFIKARAGAWLLFQEGSLEVGDTLAAPGAQSVLGFTDTLGQDEFDASPIGLVAVAIPAVDLLIEVGYLGSYNYEGDATGVNLSFDDQSITGDIASENSYDIYEFNALYELTELSIFKIHVGAGVRFFDVETEVVGTIDGSAGSVNETAFVPLPLLVAGARADLGPNFFVQGRFGGMIYGDFGNIIDGSLEVGWDFFRNVGLFAGYRVMAAESEAFDVEFDLTLQGPYAGIELRL